MEGIGHLADLLADADGMDLGPNGLLVESFLDGKEYLIEGVAWDDEVYLGSVVDRITAEGDTFDDDVHHAPTTLGAEDLAKVHRAVTLAAHAQGLRRSVMHAEVRFHDGEPHLLEIAARVGGGGLETIARLTADHDPIEAMVDVGLGRKPQVRHFQPTGTHITAMCLISDGRRRRGGRPCPTRSANSDKVFLLKITAEPGDKIKRPPDGNTILGFLGYHRQFAARRPSTTMNDFAVQDPGQLRRAGASHRTLYRRAFRAFGARVTLTSSATRAPHGRCGWPGPGRYLMCPPATSTSATPSTRGWSRRSRPTAGWRWCSGSGWSTCSSAWATRSS